MAGINISFVSDVRSFIKGTDDIERAMDDVGDSLDDVSKDAKTAGDKIERSLSDAGKDAEQSSDKMEKSFRKDFDKVADHAKDAGDKIERSAKGSMTKAGDASGDFKRETMANVSETASSFDGSMEGISDMVQGTMGGLAELPGVGLGIAGLAAAGGAVAAMWTKHTEAIKAQVEGMFEDMIESGEDYLSQSYIQEQYWAIVQGSDDAILKQGELNKIVEMTGLTMGKVALAYAGDQDAIAHLQDVLNGKLADQVALTQEAGFTGSSAFLEQNGELNRMLDGLDEYAERVDKTTSRVGEGQAAWDRYEDSQAKTTQNAVDDMARLSAAVTSIPSPVIRPTIDLGDVKREIREVTDGVYQVRINGVRSGMAYR